MRRLVIVAVAVAGFALFGSGVRGLAALDDRLEAATGPREAGTHEVRLAEPRGRDCPWPRHRNERQL